MIVGRWANVFQRHCPISSESTWSQSPQTRTVRPSPPISTICEHTKSMRCRPTWRPGPRTVSPSRGKLRASRRRQKPPAREHSRLPALPAPHDRVLHSMEPGLLTLLPPIAAALTGSRQSIKHGEKTLSATVVGTCGRFLGVLELLEHGAERPPRPRTAPS